MDRREFLKAAFGAMAANELMGQEQQEQKQEGDLEKPEGKEGTSETPAIADHEQETKHDLKALTDSIQELATELARLSIENPKAVKNLDNISRATASFAGLSRRVKLLPMTVLEKFKNLEEVFNLKNFNFKESKSTNSLETVKDGFDSMYTNLQEIDLPTDWSVDVQEDAQKSIDRLLGEIGIINQHLERRIVDLEKEKR